MKDKLLKIKVAVEIECGKEKCIVSKKRCRYLVESGYRDKLLCRLFGQHIWNSKVIFQGDYLRRCDECIVAEIKEAKNE